MVMVDSLLKTDEIQSTSSFKLSADNIFCGDGFFTEAGLIENIAQTAAIRAGFEVHQKGEKVKVGFIGAVKKLKIYRLPKDNKTLTTTIKIVHNFNTVSIVKGEVWAETELMAEAELSIFTREENKRDED